MKKITLLLLLFVSSAIYSQTNGITYQALILNPNGEKVPGVNNVSAPLANKDICLQFTIIDAAFKTEYQETINIKTDEFGMVNTIIGSGRQTAGYALKFSDIYWDVNKKSLKVALDVNGQCLNFIDISEQLLTYVPFAFSAKNAENVTGVVPIENGGTNAITVLGAKTNLGLENVDNTTDLDKPTSNATQQALNVKENLVNKSIDVTVDGISDEKYPTVKAVKTYVDANASIGSAALAAEVARAKNAESTLETNLNTEISRAVGAEATKEDLVNKSSSVIVDGNSDVKYPTVKSVKNYVDDNMTTGANALSQEVARAIAAEKNIATELSAEITTRATADANLLIDIAQETSRATVAEATLATNLAAETTRAITAEATKEVLVNKSTSIVADGISDTKYPSVRSVKTYVDATAATGSNALAVETARATAAENTIATDLATETLSRVSRDNVLTNNLAAEVTRAKGVEDTNASAIVAEKDRATAAELTKENAANKSTDGTFALNSDEKFPTEKATKTYVDGKATAVSSALTSETDRATAAEDVLTTDLAAEAATRLANDATLATSVTTEKSRAILAEGTLTTGLASEITRATTAENANATAITAETTRATAAELTKENAANKSTDGTFALNSDEKFPTEKATKTYVDSKATSASSALSSETDRATAAEDVLTTDLAAEAATRLANDTALATSVTTEKDRAILAEGTLTTNLNAEATIRAAADVVLTDDLAAEVSRATTAEGNLTTNLANEVSRATAAEATKELLANKSTSVSADGLSDDKYSSVKSVKTYVDASTSAANTALALETAARISADNTLTTNLNSEISTRTTAVSTVTTNLASEAATRLAADNTLTNNLAAEVLTRASAVSLLTTNLENEITRATNAEVTLTTNLGLEKTRAMGVEATKENAANKSVDGTLASNSDVKFPTEQAVKTYVDNAVAGTTDALALIAAETARAKSAENTITSNLNTEKSNRILGDNALAADLQTEVDRAIEAEATKEDLINKSYSVTTDGASNIKYPTVKSVKTYVDTEIAVINALADGKIYLGNASGVATEVALSGEATMNNSGSVTLNNAAVINKVLTGFTTATGAVVATDSVLGAIQKIEGNKSTDVFADKLSDIKYPSAKAVKTYVDTYSTINAISTITANYTALITDYTILSNGTAGGFTLTLPNASTATGKVYVIRKTDETTNLLSFSPALKLTETTTISSINYPKTIRVQSNGTSWYVID